MQKETSLPSSASPLLRPQVPQCIVHSYVNYLHTSNNTKAADQELVPSCIRGEIKEAINLRPMTTEDREEIQYKEEEKSAKNEENIRIAGPDGGWSWVVLLGAFVVMTLVSTVGPCFSLVFSKLLLALGSSSITVAWIFNIFSLVWNVVGPVVGPLTAEVGHRKVAMVGSFMMAAALIISSFAFSTWHLLLCFSVLGGLGAGLVVTTSVLIVPLYFTHRLGRANGVFMAGTSVGQFIAPHLITFLQDRYAFTGATLILGAIVLNTSVAAATFHPVSWHTGHLDCEIGKPFPEKVFLRQSASSRQLNSNLASSNQVTSNRKSSEMNGLLLRVAQSTLRDLGILRSPRALIIAVSSTLVVNGYLNFIMMVPFMVQEAGHSPQSSAWCVSVSGVFNLLTRLAMSAFSECPCFNMHICYVVGIFTIAASSLAFSFLTNATWLMVVMGVWGCGVGAFMGLYNLVMIRYMGIHNLPPMFGAASLLNGLGFITLGPLLGWVRDLSESYAFSIWLLASTQFLCVLLWFFMPAAVARDERRALQDNNSAD